MNNFLIQKRILLFNFFIEVILIKILIQKSILLSDQLILAKKIFLNFYNIKYVNCTAESLRLSQSRHKTTKDDKRRQKTSKEA